MKLYPAYGPINRMNMHMLLLKLKPNKGQFAPINAANTSVASGLTRCSSRCLRQAPQACVLKMISNPLRCVLAALTPLACEKQLARVSK